MVENERIVPSASTVLPPVRPPAPEMTDDEAIQVLLGLQAERRNWERQNMAMRQLERLVDAARSAQTRMAALATEMKARESALADLDKEYGEHRTRQRKAIEQIKAETEATVKEYNDKKRVAEAGMVKLAADTSKAEAAANDKIKELTKKIEEQEMALAKATSALAQFKADHKL